MASSASEKNLLDPRRPELTYTSPQPTKEKKKQGRINNMSDSDGEEGDQEFVLSKTLFNVRGRTSSKSYGNIQVPLQPIRQESAKESDNSQMDFSIHDKMALSKLSNSIDEHGEEDDQDEEDPTDVALDRCYKYIHSHQSNDSSRDLKSNSNITIHRALDAARQSQKLGSGIKVSSEISFKNSKQFQRTPTISPTNAIGNPPNSTHKRNSSEQPWFFALAPLSESKST